MPSIVARFDPDIGPVIAVSVSKRNTSQFHETTALIDTGARTSSISSFLATRVGLVSIGTVDLISATQRLTVETFLTDLLIPCETESVTRRGLILTEFLPDGQLPYHILLGRDILSQGHLTMFLDGYLVLSL